MQSDNATITKTTPTVFAEQKVASEIPNELIKQLIADINTNKNNFRLSEEDLKILNDNLKYNLRDLNDDGISEFFLYIDHSDWCGAGSNCSDWVYQKTKSGYRLLVEDKVLRVGNAVTNGYKDLLSETKLGLCKDAKGRTANNLYITPYKYDGEKYQEQKMTKECREFSPE